MKYVDKEIKSVANLLSLFKRRSSKEKLTWFRGQGDISWKLIPSLSRLKKPLETEFSLMKRFKQNAIHFLNQRPNSDWDWLLLMQHYGVPTRLLDWTENPLIALYFVVNESQYFNKDGILWCLLPKKFNIISNYQTEAADLPFFGVDDLLDNFLPENMAQGPSITQLPPIAATSMRESRRLFSQFGVFTITHLSALPVEDVGDQSHVWRIIIPKTAKEDIRKELAFLGFTKLTLFPELPSVADIAKEILE